MKESDMAKSTKIGPETEKSNETPSFDFKKLLEQFKLPGVDLASLLEREKKNIEAFTKANMVAFEGWQALVQKQTEIFKDTMAQAIAIARTPNAVGNQAEIAKEGFEKALDHMHALAEIAVKSQNDAFDIVRKRIQENLDEMRNLRRK
jgi:phasin family protein